MGAADMQAEKASRIRVERNLKCILTQNEVALVGVGCCVKRVSSSNERRDEEQEEKEG